MNNTNNVALVTGASSSIGKAVSSERDLLMNATKHVVKLYRIIFIFSALVACHYSAFCEISQIGIHEEQLTDEQYKKYINVIEVK
jgi:NADP-dependent 3-hydroxy acid dehydrogenase YdfG